MESLKIKPKYKSNMIFSTKFKLKKLIMLLLIQELNYKTLSFKKIINFLVSLFSIGMTSLTQP